MIKIIIFYSTVLFVILCTLFLSSLWKIFNKTGRNGYMALIPFWNIYVLIRIAGLPRWWFLLIFVPVLNLVVWILILYHLATHFGKHPTYVLGLFYLWFVFFPMLAFGHSQYIEKN